MPSDLLTTARVIQTPAPGREGPATGPERPATGPDWPAADLLPELPEPEGISGAEGTLLAVVPIPGTDSSLAIVGYTVPRAPARVTDGSGAPTAPTAPTATAPQPAARPDREPAARPDRGLVVDHARRCAWMNGKAVALTYQEFELLAFLSAHPDQVFSRADLLARVWDQLPKSSTRARTRTVDVHVSRLRRKLGSVYGPCLTTEYRVGYRFAPALSGVA